MNTTKAFELLGLDGSSTVDEVKAAYRLKAGEHHPDRGGDADTFDLYRQAYKAALEHAKKPKKCDLCNGTGRETLTVNWITASKICSKCRGSGSQQ